MSGRHYRYYDMLMAGFVTVLLCSNLIGTAKVCMIELPFALPIIGNHLTFGAGNIFFPISYIFGDVLTEVYGFARARKVIWAGFGAMIFATVMSQVIIHLPPAPDEPFNVLLQPAIETVFGATWRIVVASILAFWIGDFVNSYVLARMKVMTQGRMLWTRTIGSTIFGQGCDTAIFLTIAFYGDWPTEMLTAIILNQWLFKVGYETLATPFTYLVVGKLKRAEGVDFYDTHTHFSPFAVKE